MAWNLVDALSRPGERRKFFLPLASIPPEKNVTSPVDPNLFDINPNNVDHLESSVTGGGLISDIGLSVRITPPVGGFADENDLPHPAIRIHAIDNMIVRFKPADGAMRDRLIGQMPRFSMPITEVRWWPRWVEAGCIPHTIIFENVDRNQLEERLNAISPAATNPDGVDFPLGVDIANKQDYIQRFFSGDDMYIITARAGSYIGTVGAEYPISGQVNSTTLRLLILHARYHDHSNMNPNPMNPRELFHLLFGDDSDEARNHPLLRRINDVGQNRQNNIQPESKRMLLRPPLRTWKRVMWEGNQEIDNNHVAHWSPGGALGTDRFYNDHVRGGLNFDDGPYDATYCFPNGCSKCNLFVSDICLRAGFHVCIHNTGTSWHYTDANAYSNFAQQRAGVTDRIPLQGQNEDATTIWGWKVENWLRAQPVADRQRLLNEAMTEEGRCFILAGARGRKFVPYIIIPGTIGIANCNLALRREGIGHILIVREVTGQPQLAAIVGDGLQSIPVLTLEAVNAGALRGIRDGTPGNPLVQLGGVPGAPAGATGYISLHLIELQPGKDPETFQGLRNLNIRNVNRNLLGTANERAGNVRITHTATGVPLPAPPNPGQCCQDQHPPQNAVPTQGPC